MHSTASLIALFLQNKKNPIFPKLIIQAISFSEKKFKNLKIVVWTALNVYFENPWAQH